MTHKKLSECDFAMVSRWFPATAARMRREAMLKTQAGRVFLKENGYSRLVRKATQTKGGK